MENALDKATTEAGNTNALTVSTQAGQYSEENVTKTGDQPAEDLKFEAFTKDLAVGERGWVAGSRPGAKSKG